METQIRDGKEIERRGQRTMRRVWVIIQIHMWKENKRNKCEHR